mgnify:CR=1 FL=1
MKNVNLVATMMTMLLVITPAIAETVVDVNKQVINKTPYQVEVCYDRQVSGDKTGDAIKGAIIGGILGNNIKGEEGGGALGAVLGAMAGHANSDATGGTRRVCNVETRYNETVATVYSHSIVSFLHEGKEYQLKFQK